MTVKILQGDCREVLRTLPDESVHCVVTSPPYFGLRDYGVAGQIGLEPSPSAFVEEMVSVFSEVRRILRADGTLWLNLGDSYSSSPPGTKRPGASGSSTLNGIGSETYRATLDAGTGTKRDTSKLTGFKPKDLLGIPWRVAFALQVDGWYLRQDIIWSKPNPMPESVRDRCTKAHEYIFLLSKSERYYYDADAIAEPAIFAGDVKDYTGDQKNNDTDPDLQRTRIKNKKLTVGESRNKRTVWNVATSPYADAHFATFPPALIEPCILAGCPKGGTVLDPFGGAGTTGMVADRLGRNAILIELNPDYADMAHRRIKGDAGMFADVVAIRE